MSGEKAADQNILRGATINNNLKVDLKNMKLSKKEKSDVEAGKSSSGEKN